ncbi:hypothetical protein BDK51DRAFT_41385 [Blyttiomyces helicus]|uniref:Uncharacterized protein n=1 Tax=Blyttiomyces helicus TaxID=388810 RepID=A0A4P9W1P7_9FUNG|nr:hypothetical protein BDK51DRAFT_41385 [Blyttiomyces helicus]|eukprot:RKO85602.1 hypothetical protein BDK51DRAFT_41385 [Blyttiomyces helicus]
MLHSNSEASSCDGGGCGVVAVGVVVEVGVRGGGDCAGCGAEAVGEVEELGVEEEEDDDDDDDARKAGKLARHAAEKREVHFTDHPLIDPTDPDLLHPLERTPGYSLPRAPTIFAQITTPELRAKILNTAPDLITIDPTIKNPASAPTGPGNLTRADRRLRRHLARCGSAVAAVRDFESAVRRFLDESGGVENAVGVPGVEAVDVDEGWVRVEMGAEQVEISTALPLVLAITDKFLRLVVHAMCRYYGLPSHNASIDPNRPPRPPGRLAPTPLPPPRLHPRIRPPPVLPLLPGRSPTRLRRGATVKDIEQMDGRGADGADGAFCIA